MRYRMRYALAGGILGLGSPVGSLIWRAVISGQGTIVASVIREWHHYSYFYNYMTVGTVIVFGLFGYVLGRRDENLNALSITDGLTGIFNHRYLQEQLLREIQRSDRYRAPLTCLMVDIDDFKKVNDLHGHPFGDRVLSTTARMIREAVRQIDIVGRYGGEEFLVIMPQTTSVAALPIAERILNAVRNHPFMSSMKAIHVTLSIGLATYPSPQLGVKTKNGLLSAADQALYKAKRLGKNQTSVWDA